VWTPMTRNPLHTNGCHTVHSVHTMCVFLYRGVVTVRWRSIQVFGKPVCTPWTVDTHRW
jgi:hypothetical protein